MGFTICYSFRGNQRVLECQEDNLCGHDAVYYALLHSGAELGNMVGGWQGSYPSIVEAAERSGVSNVLWHKSLTQLSS
ncbi:hypothetical protein BWR59_25855 [Pseudomonas sp. Bc-h]|jgi:hypothetical protein|uniref:hypothetical protein n=1 Tax=unclassified Pseudomonas TaxID=196821 RepID=UPI0009D95BB3|nr:MULTISPECIES: hypothetical protein [unclassified Pseudomonas]MDE1195971.1 hypothetical protein [Pseudomonas sp.]OQR27673.1 hypothetical protein BWR59_25855 [Pseudomonas sp. Bc-h]